MSENITAETQEQNTPGEANGAASGNAGDAASQEGFKAITTQEEFDKAIASRISREKNKTSAAVKRAETAESELAELKAKNQISDWKQEIAEAKGVPANLLRGTTKEELEAHAEELAAFVAPPAAPVVSGDGNQPGDSKENPYAEMASGLFGN